MFFRSVEGLLVGLPAILIAISFHEFAHGKVAAMLGDPTPHHQGRLTLNPLAHLDVLGALMLVVVGFGWAKPVQVNPFYFRGDRRKGMMLVGLAGPVMNLVLAYLAAVAAHFFHGWYASMFFGYLVWFNAMLAVFNLIPVPPLDGSKILAGIVPREYANLVYGLESYGPLILLLLFFTGIIGYIMRPAVKAVIAVIEILSSIGYF